MTEDDEKIHELYLALGDHKYKKIVSREGLVVLAAALGDQLEEVHARYDHLRGEIRRHSGELDDAVSKLQSMER